MKKIYRLILLLIIFLIQNLISYAEPLQEDLKLRTGSFIKVMAREEFSTLTSDIGDEYIFICPQDFYVYEADIVPENTLFFGIVEDIKEPVQGRDGAMKIKIYKMIKPDKTVRKINAHIYSENDNYIGGKETASTYYRKVPHYIHRLRPFLQAAPLNVYEMGRHTVIKPGTEFFVVLEEDLPFN